mmetsp:Transcript_41974/g.110574  ORF Transcript_41974/g.110574 Transcript_41974/m.110574 type:complete len:174 (+) Transcript_41974:41-562(+)
MSLSSSTTTDLITERSARLALLATEVAQIAAVPAPPSTQSTRGYDEYGEHLNILASVLDNISCQLQQQLEACQRALSIDFQRGEVQSNHDSFIIEPTSVLLASEASMERIMSTVSNTEDFVVYDDHVGSELMHDRNGCGSADGSSDGWIDGSPSFSLLLPLNPQVQSVRIWYC